MSLQHIERFYATHRSMVKGLFTAGFFSIAEVKGIFNYLTGGLDGKSVLDLGCGNGDMLEHLHSMYQLGSSLGVDICEQSLREARARPTCASSRFLRADLNRDFVDTHSIGLFDCVLLLDTYEHLESDSHVFTEIRKLCKQSTVVVVAGPNYFNFAGMLKAIMEIVGPFTRNTWAPFGNRTPQANERFVTSYRLRRTVSRCGFIPMKESGHDVIGAVWPFIYGHTGLTGFWSRHTRAYWQINRQRYLGRILRRHMMYYVLTMTPC